MGTLGAKLGCALPYCIPVMDVVYFWQHDACFGSLDLDAYVGVCWSLMRLLERGECVSRGMF